MQTCLHLFLLDSEELQVLLKFCCFCAIVKTLWVGVFVHNLCTFYLRLIFADLIDKLNIIIQCSVC